MYTPPFSEPHAWKPARRGPGVILFLAVLLAAAAPPVSAQKLQSLEFRNQDIVDILAVLAKVSGTSIIPDSTVSGKATYFFSDIEFDQAFKAFLYTYKLYAQFRDGMYYVSRIRVEYRKDTGTVDIDAEDVDVSLLVRSLSLAAGKTVLYDPLPRRELTIHLQNIALDKALEIFVLQLPEFSVEVNANFYYLRNTTPPKSTDTAVRRKEDLVGVDTGGLYSLEVKQARFADILAELFRKAGLEYSLFMRPDLNLENMSFRGKTFEQLLRLVLDQAGADFSREESVYYIYEVQRRDILKRLKVTEFLPLSYISTQDLPNLLPQEFATQGFFRLDRAANTVILTGSVEEIAPVREFIKTLDRPTGGLSYARYDLRHRKVKDIVPMVLLRYQNVQPLAVPDTNSFTVLATEQTRKDIAAYLELVDIPKENSPVHLRFITSKTLLETLPPSIERENIVPTQDPNLVFFLGSPEKRAAFLSELELLDQPVPQIRYELLVVQYRKGGILNWSPEISNAELPNSGSDGNVFLGALGNLLSLNFDIVSTFGYLFAVRLNASLSENAARILADTTLNGLTGEEIRFQNTNTYRYRDFEIDPDTGKPKATGITRELTSGLIINIKGWVSGEGMITMNVSSTVSKRGADVSNQNSNPPSTSEKVVSTNVRTLSGTPVIISGLFQQEVDIGVKKVPLLGDIPLLGALFQSRVESVEDTELVIYIVPHLELRLPAEVQLEDRLESIYAKIPGGENP